MTWGVHISSETYRIVTTKSKKKKLKSSLPVMMIVCTSVTIVINRQGVTNVTWHPNSILHISYALPWTKD